MASSGNATWNTGFRPAQLGLIVIIAAVIGGLYSLDWSLKQTEQTEMQDSAWRAYRNGVALLKQGKTAQAVDAFRTAHALERSNQEYELGLIEALTAAGKIDEAEPLMNEVLDENRNDGRANLVAARLALRKKNIREAKAYYHRAIYGNWPDGSAQHRIDVRFELISLLQTQGDQHELLAELLPLEQEVRKNEPLQKKLAQLFLVAGAPSHAAELYRAILDRDPNDAAAYTGLAEADLQLGEYRAARGNFLEAYYHDPHNPGIRSRLELASSLASLDPTVRQLPSAEKYRRSLRVLDLAVSDLQQCLAGQPSQNTTAIQNLIASAKDATKAPASAGVTNETAEHVLAQAEKIWQARVKACPGVPSTSEEPLRLIMDKLTQSSQ